MPGYLSHELRRCVELSNRYLLLVHWRSIEDHTIGFRQSPDYQRWRSLLHHFYDPFPVVEHYSPSLINDFDKKIAKKEDFYRKIEDKKMEKK